MSGVVGELDELIMDPAIAARGDGEAIDLAAVCGCGLEPVMPLTREERDRREHQIRRYHEVIKRFVHGQQFGVGVPREDNPAKLRPVHLNTTGNPRPKIGWINGTQICLPATPTDEMSREHLMGLAGHGRSYPTELFMVSRADRREALLRLDLDADEPGDWGPGAEWGAELLRRLFPKLEPFLEAGRSWPRKATSYTSFRIDFGGVPANVRHLTEHLLNRYLLRLAEQFPPPEGVRLDALKGTTTYTYRNLEFSPPFAQADSLDAQSEFKMDGVWLPRREAKRLIRFYAKHAGRELSPHEVKDELKRYEHRWAAKTNLESYESLKSFYRVDGVEFRYEPQLERTKRHFGHLVTTPCLRALSTNGERENNIDAFVDWCDNRAGRVTFRRLVKALPQEDQELIAKAMELAKAGDDQPFISRINALRGATRVVSESVDGVPPSHHRTSTAADPGRGDMGIMLDPLESAWSRLCASVRLYLRRHKGDIAKAVKAAVRWYEDEGPATGHSQAEHEDRLSRARRIAAHYAATYDHAKHGASSAVGITSVRIENTAASLKRLVRDRLLELVNGDLTGRQVTRRHIAAVYLVMLRNIASNNGYVPTKSIARFLKSMGISMGNAMIAACKRALRLSGLLSLVKGHSKKDADTPGTCERWAVPSHAWRPRFLESLLGRRVKRGARLGATAHETPGGGAVDEGRPRPLPSGEPYEGTPLPWDLDGELDEHRNPTSRGVIALLFAAAAAIRSELAHFSGGAVCAS